MSKISHLLESCLSIIVWTGHCTVCMLMHRSVMLKLGEYYIALCASSYLRHCYIVLSRRIGSGQTRCVFCDLCWNVGMVSDCRTRRLQLATPLMLSVCTPDTNSFFTSLLNGNCFWWRFWAYILATDVGIIIWEGRSWEDLLDKLLQFRSDGFREGWGEIALVYDLWTGADHALLTRTLPLVISSANFRGVTGCHLGNVVNDITFHTFHTNTETRRVWPDRILRNCAIQQWWR